MSARQIQIRRGTEDEHANFTGAIGEITMDTTNKTLRVHDGETVGGTVLAKKDEVPDINTMDYVVATQEPTAENNFAWYRRYKSGWVEQGGRVFNNRVSETVSLPVEMRDMNFVVMACYYTTNDTGGFGTSPACGPKSTRTIWISKQADYCVWTVKGFAV